MTLKLNHLHLKTKDPEKTAKFYVDNLGAKIVSQSASGGYRLDLHGLSLNVSNFLEKQTREMSSTRWWKNWTNRASGFSSRPRSRAAGACAFSRGRTAFSSNSSR